MTEVAKRRLLLSSVLALATIVFLTGIQWGLPSRAVDPFLFGDHPVWTGEQILALKGSREKSNDRGADVDSNPIVDRTCPVLLNETDQQRAEIVLRYRLYSYQPDEMNTLMALASMHPGAGDFDPKMYKYGGLWVYPVGAMLKITSVMKLIHLTPDLAYYLDHPEAFGRFYIVARFYTAMWGVIGAPAVFLIASRLSCNVWVAAAATVCFIFMPVVVTMAHEAKPHLPGAVLTLLAVIAATKYVETGRRGWVIGTGAICGAAVGMVLSAWVAFLVIPAMLILRRKSAKKQILLGIASACVGVVVYFVTNPYVAVHLINNRELLRTNLGNSAAFYRFSLAPAALINAIRLILEGVSPPLAVGGMAAIAVLLVYRLWRKPPIPPMVWLLAAPAIIGTAQFVMFAINQPMDYARFALLPDIMLVLASIIGADFVLRSTRWRVVAMTVLLLSVTGAGTLSLQRFVRDCQVQTSRLRTAESIRQKTNANILAVTAEPAPYILPPVDLFRWKITLVSPENVMEINPYRVFLIRSNSKITWADAQWLPCMMF